jgi:hypothetical protein
MVPTSTRGGQSPPAPMKGQDRPAAHEPGWRATDRAASRTGCGVPAAPPCAATGSGSRLPPQAARTANGPGQPSPPARAHRPLVRKLRDVWHDEVGIPRAARSPTAAAGGCLDPALAASLWATGSQGSQRCWECPPTGSQMGRSPAAPQQAATLSRAAELRGGGAPRGIRTPTARSVAWCSASIWSAPDRSGLLTLDAPSVQTALEGSRRIVWMIKAQPTENRMARQQCRATPVSAAVPNLRRLAD